MRRRYAHAADGSTRAVVFDFNGTLSDDEPVLARDLPGALRRARPADDASAEYYEQLAGHTDEEMLDPLVRPRATTSWIAERIDRYTRSVADGSTVDEEMRAALRFAAERVPVAIVSARRAREIDARRRGAGPPRRRHRCIVSQDDVDERQAATPSAT